MREIKFRFWNGYEIKPVRAINFNSDFYEDDHSHISDVEDIEKSPFLMQYTGLKDKNGKEIYEGDIVKLSNGKVSQISYVYDGWWFDGYDNDIIWEDRKNDFRHIEVIGNIYENPELLKSDE